MMKYIPLVFVALLMVACGSTTSMKSDKNAVYSSANKIKLKTILSSQPEETQARYNYRHPEETLAFFGIKPGMTVVEALPGGGWYTKILLPYLGTDGHLIGVDYPIEIWPKFGFFPPEFIEKKKTWVADWSKEASGWRGPDDAPIDAFVFGSMPAKVTGKADAVLFIRALHNLNRFEDDGKFLTIALKDSIKSLKSGGIVGVVQHRAPESASADTVTGSRGYLKTSDVISSMEKAGLKFVAASEINANPKDNATEKDIVWRLPPTYFDSAENPERKAEMTAIGESDRMTLKFRKP